MNLDPDDYIVRGDGQTIGRIRCAHDRSPVIWTWTITVLIPGAPFGDAATIDEAKARFKIAWEAFKAKHGPEKLAKAYAAMNHALGAAVLAEGDIGINPAWQSLRRS